MYQDLAEVERFLEPSQASVIHADNSSAEKALPNRRYAQRLAEQAGTEIQLGVDCGANPIVHKIKLLVDKGADLGLINRHFAESR